MVIQFDPRTGQVKLYTTSGCHLCDDALVLLKQAQLAVELVEIADDDSLYHRYGLRIPVVARVAGGDVTDELNWPFDADLLASWLTLTC
ncbi:MAG: glutaredoxin family protein [Gammaproteobacteria bacterium]|nr:MAG: glutaredoxin family protein [Gammaproteobacteria bacterium]RLA11869.1 MAG: glutaredoxin family protein [Gammaproteobacteria bacterium]RLA12045.1 MAG: glutaredoxin family protein [Gammaproteobacteria bacterium]